MAEILTLSSGALESRGEDKVAPIVNPAGPLPSSQALSQGAAAQAAKEAPIAKEAPAILGIDLKDRSLNNLVFLGALSFILFKYGRRFFQ